jgi:RNA polymerase sigma factor (sigma-70 family)
MPGQTPDPDPDLIRRWQRSDRAAFEQIVHHWHPRVARFLARLTGCPEMARDLAQEAFLRVYLSAGTYREGGHFPTWLFQIALNLARDAARKSARRPAVPLADADPAAPAGGKLEDRERADAVAAALAELSGPLREVVVLRHYEDMSFEAMARLLGTPASTLKSRFTVALRQLHERLAGFAPEDAHDL